VVAEPCINCKYTDCVEVCPVDCFHEGPNILVIDPETCIDCGACELACPPRAIFPEYSLPEQWKGYVELNATQSKRWPVLSAKKEPMPEADRWRYQAGKSDQVDLT